MDGPARILLEGRPGVGKTTLAGRVADELRAAGVPLTGFLTTELREGGRRIGFTAETFDGGRAILAHVDLPGPPRVGRYGVDLDAFDRIVLPALERVRDDQVALLDELGKMELASERFRAAVLNLFERAISVVATVQAARHPFTDALKCRPDTEVVRVTKSSRDDLIGEVVSRLRGDS
jgi:nucleoside-triphosphatase